MSWESSIEYERLINEEVRRTLGGNTSADLIIRSYNFAEVEALQEASDWDAAGAMLAQDAVLLEDAGAEIIVLCTNTMHEVAQTIESALGETQFLHIADVVGDAIEEAGLTTVALLGTRYTMERQFYRDRLEQRGITTMIPDEPDRSMINDVIFDELVRGKIVSESRMEYRRVATNLVSAGAEGIIAGCTEIELLIGSDDVSVPYFPSTRLHARAAVKASLA